MILIVQLLEQIKNSYCKDNFMNRDIVLNRCIKRYNINSEKM